MPVSDHRRVPSATAVVSVDHVVLPLFDRDARSGVGCRTRAARLADPPRGPVRYFSSVGLLVSRTSRPRGRCRRAGPSRTGRRSASSLTESSKTGALNGSRPADLATGGLGDRVLHRRAGRCRCRWRRDILKSGLSAPCCPARSSRATLPSEVARAGMDRPALGERGQRADQRRAEVGHDDVDLLVLRDRRGQHLLGQGRVPVGRLERLLADERVLARGSSTSCRPSSSALPWLLPFGPLRNRTLPPSGTFLVIQLAQLLAVVREVGADPGVVVLAVLAAGVDPVGHGDDAGLVGAAAARQHRLAGVGEDHQRVDALGDHALDVGDGLLGVALAVGVDELRHAGALAASSLPDAVVTSRQLLPPKPSVRPRVISFVAAPGGRGPSSWLHRCHPVRPCRVRRPSRRTPARTSAVAPTTGDESDRRNRVGFMSGFPSSVLELAIASDAVVPVLVASEVVGVRRDGVADDAAPRSLIRAADRLPVDGVERDADGERRGLDEGPHGEGDAEREDELLELARGTGPRPRSPRDSRGHRGATCRRARRPRPTGAGRRRPGRRSAGP